MVDVAQLSDATLKEELISHGINPGPITPSTRSVYEKKLNKILNDTSALNNSATESIVVPPSPPPQQINIDPVETRKSPIPVPVFQTTSNQEENGEASDAEDYEGEESMRYLTEDEINADRQKYAKNTQQSGGLRKFFIISTAIASIAVFSYFLLENVESLLSESSALSSSSSSNHETI